MKICYVLSRKDIDKSSSAVQAGHALSELLLNGPDHITKSWNNNTLIFLGIENIRQLKYYCKKLDRVNIPWFGFNEPDLDNELTAIATIVEDRKIFSKLNLL